ncbi:MAG: molybdopterin dinucleotide-binding protein [Porticoccaceae bacterium]|nr:molybdopterin dinucleotide-binding protein [Porticoccaceae bacterium]
MTVSSARATHPHTVTTRHRRVCPLCEGMCGVELTVENNHRVLSVHPDPDNAWSQGHVCPKGIQLGALHHDPDRLTWPMIRDGEKWHEVTWEEAFEHIETLVARVREKHGQQAFGFYGGNMSGKGFDSSRYMMLLLQHAKFAQRFSSSSVDQLPKNLTSHILYGNMWKIPIPDVDNTDLFVILGGNPAASKGSIFSHRDVMGAIKKLRARGGKVIVIDPVRTKTAQQADQWLPIKPGADAALLLAVAHVLFAEGRVNTGHLTELLNGLDEIRRIAERFSPERVADFCGLAAEDIRALARAIADAPRAAVYGRIGTCTQPFGTLASWMVDIISILTGNLDRIGGAMWSTQVAPHLDLTPPYPSDAPIVSPPIRVRGVPGILGQYPASCLAEEIDTPGEGQIRALLTLGCNPVLTAPGSERLAKALDQLECMVSLDIYINETTCHADVILPSPSLLEQPHWDVWAWPWSLTSGGHYSPTTIPAGDRPEEWRVMARLGAIFGGNPDADVNKLDDEFFAGICRRVGLEPDDAFKIWPQRGAERILDLCIRTGPFGDKMGSNPDGLSLQSFKDNPDGIIIGHAEPQGADAITTPSGKIEMAHPHILADLPRLEAAIDDTDNSLLLVSRRHLGSMNSWMHNVDKLVRGKDRCTLQIHPDDAERHGLAVGDRVAVESESGRITASVEITDDIRPGIVCLPHGWGHNQPQSQLQVARRHPGVNINILSPGRMIDEPSGNAVLNGIPVHLEKIPEND